MVLIGPQLIQEISILAEVSHFFTLKSSMTSYKFVVKEGIKGFHRRLFAAFSGSVFVESPKDLGKKRGLTFASQWLVIEPRISVRGAKLPLRSHGPKTDGWTSGGSLAGKLPATVLMRGESNGKWTGDEQQRWQWGDLVYGGRGPHT